MTINIQKIQTKHAASIKILLDQLGYGVTPQTIDQQLKVLLDSSDDMIYGAVWEERLVGLMHITKMHRLTSPSFAEIVTLVVHENEREKGIGKALIEKGVLWVKEQSVDLIRVRCNMKRNAAHQFYANLGFELIKEQKVFQTSASNFLSF